MLIPYLNDYRVNFFERLEQDLNAQGYLLKVFVGREGRRNDRADTFPVHKLREIRPFGSSKVRFRMVSRDFLSGDVVVLEQALGNLETYILLFVRKVTGRPTALWGHGWTITQPQARWEKLLQAFIARRSDWLFAYTEGSSARAVASGVNPRRISVLTNTLHVEGIGVETLTDLQALKPLDDRFECAFVGALDESKRIGFLLDAFSQAQRLRPTLRLTIAGDGPHRELVMQSRLPGVRYVGSLTGESKRRMMSGAQLLLMPGRVGLVAVESFVYGCPVITTQWAWHAPEFEYLSQSDSVVTPDDTTAFAEAIVQLVDDPERLRQLQMNALMRQSAFSLDAMVESFVKGIAEVLK